MYIYSTIRFHEQEQLYFTYSGARKGVLRIAKQNSERTEEKTDGGEKNEQDEDGETQKKEAVGAYQTTCVTCQKASISIVTTVRTSNLREQRDCYTRKCKS